MYVRPSTSRIRAPRARSMNGGSPPTAPNARTGLSTPPGSTRLARANNLLDSERGARGMRGEER